MKLTIGAQMRLLVTAVAVGLGLCVLVTFHLLAARQTEATIRADAEAVQSALRTFIKDRGGLQVQLTRFLATSPRVSMLAMADDATVKDMIGDVRKTADVDGLLMLDTKGHRLGSDGLRAPDEVQAAVRALTREAMTGRGGHAIVEADGDPILAASEPLYVGKNFQGVLTTFLRMDAKMAKTIGRNVRGDVAFVHRGRVLGASIPLGGIRLDGAASTRTLDVGGTTYFARLAPMPETPAADGLSVVILRSYDDATAAYRELTSAFMAVLAGVTLVSLLGGATLTQTLTRPLDRVVRAARVLQGGEWPEPFRSRRKDEVGLLQTVFDDMTASMRADKARLLAMIDHDPLTELDNHRRFKQRLDQETHRAAAAGDPLALVLVDLDRFGAYNDDRGHEAGDDLLRRVAGAIREASPDFASLARYGADTFAVLVPDAGSETAPILMAGLREAVRGCGATASLGFAAFPTHAQEAQALVLAAELATGRAKKLGGDGGATYDDVGKGGADPYEVSRLMQDATLATIQALAAAVDAKDPYTKGHSLRVAEMARDLCAYLGGSAEETARIYRAGTLHDVGKIGVPDAILKKPARLDEDERHVMEAHPVLGEIIVRKVPQLEELLPGVRHHHETYDGRGYPDGLAGEAIPRMARIMAVADTYDAMTSDRPYRKGLPIEVALGEITKGAGTQFDPAMAHAFCAMIRSSVAVAA